MKHTLKLLVVVALVGAAFTPGARAQGTAFTYQGHLRDGGASANGQYDLQLSLWDSATSGSQVGPTIVTNPVAASNGVFTVTPDFGGGQFNGNARWLQIGVRSNGSVAAYTTLAPRQPITPAPYAIKAANAMTVSMGTISDPSFIGTTTSAPLDFYANNQRAFRAEAAGSNTMNVIGGFSGNYIDAGVVGATISGGGAGNYFSQRPSNHVSGYFGTIAGGYGNTVSALIGTVSGGGNNTASSPGSTVGGGYANTAGGDGSVVAGGNFNTAGGVNATIPGGKYNVANGAYSFAAGRRAQANHDGAFVLSDSTDADFASTTNNQFLIRASGGVGIGTNNPSTALAVNGTVSATAFSGNGSGLTDLNPKVTNSVFVTPFMFNSAFMFGGVATGTGPTGAPCINFPDGATGDAQFTAVLPDTFNVNTYQVKVYYTSTTTNGIIDCSVFSRGYDVGVPMPAGVGGGPLQLPSPATTTTLGEGSTDALVDSNSRIVFFQFRRRGGSANDTSTGTLQLYGINVQWTTF